MTKKRSHWCQQKGRKSSIPKTHGTTSLASYTLNLERERVCQHYTTLMVSHMILRILHGPIRCIGSYDCIMIMQLALVPYLICITHSSWNNLSTFEMEENHIALIKKAAKYLDYENLRPKLDEAISSANKGAGHILSLQVELLDHK